MILINLIFLLLFISAAITDLWRRKIYNFTTYPAIACGVVLWTMAESWQGLWFSLAGLATGLGILFLFYFVGGVGAGDVKLLGAIGALKGANFVIWVMFYTGLIGGVMAFAIIIWKGMLFKTLSNIFFLLRHPSKAGELEKGDPLYLPYGLAISLGCVCAVVAQGTVS